MIIVMVRGYIIDEMINCCEPNQKFFKRSMSTSKPFFRVFSFGKENKTL